MLTVHSHQFGKQLPPKISIVIPVFNQARNIRRVLDSLLGCLTLQSELIIVVDKSSDESALEVLKYIQDLQQISKAKFQHVLVSTTTVISSKTLFETKADNIGFEIAVGEYIIEIQSDMIMDDHGFDLRLVQCLKENPDIFAVSGRGVTSLSAVANTEFLKRARPINYLFFKFLKKFQSKAPSAKNDEELDFLSRVFPTSENFLETGIAGWRGNLIDSYSKNPHLIPTSIRKAEKRPIYLGELVTRGPICFSRNDLQDLGFLNAKAFFLGYDEIDLCIRAFESLNKAVAFMPVYLFSPAELGSTRQKKSAFSKIDYWLRLIAHNRHFRKSSTFALLKNPAMLEATSARMHKEVRYLSE
jgi:glycosyltransferase involved in cell wall biosynthesis